MLCELGPSALVSEPTVCCALLSLSGLLRGAVDEEESEERKGALMVGDTARGVISVGGLGNGGIASAILGERGAISCLSWIEWTIFSRPKEVMCFSFPLLLDSVDSGFADVLAWMLRGTEGRCWVSSLKSDRMEIKDSTLAERMGTSVQLGLGLAISIVGVVVLLCCG